MGVPELITDMAYYANPATAYTLASRPLVEATRQRPVRLTHANV